MDGVLQQFDVTNVFLHDNLEEEIYTEVPPRFKAETGNVCKLRKALRIETVLEHGLAC